MKVIDFQISFVNSNKQKMKSMNLAIFPIAELIRLKIKEQKIDSTFRKLAFIFRMTNNKISKRNTLNIMEVMCPWNNDSEELNYKKIHAMIKSGLKLLVNEPISEFKLLEHIIDDSFESSFPTKYKIGKLSKAYANFKLETWLGLGLQTSNIELHILMDSLPKKVYEIIVVNGPIYLEDDFPAVKVKVDKKQIQYMDRNNKVLFKTDIEN